MVKKNTFGKKALAIAGAVALVGGALLGAGAVYTFDNPEPVIVEHNVTVEVPYEVVVTETITEYQNITVEVPVDNGDLAFFLERAEDKMIIADASEIVAEFKAEDEAIKGAFDFVNAERDELFDMLEEAGIVVDEDDVIVKKVYNDFEDVTIVSSDYDDAEYEFILKYKVEDTEDDVKKEVFVSVSLEDGEYEMINVSE